MSVIRNEQSAIKAECADRNVGLGELPDLIKDVIPVKMEEHEKESKQAICFQAV